MANPKRRMSSQDLVERLEAHPELRERIESLLGVVEDEKGDLKLADDAEERVIQEMRRMGQAALQGWALRQVSSATQEMLRTGKAHREGKKNFTGTLLSDA